MLQVWAGSKQRELGANSMQLMHQYCPWAALFLGILVPLVEPVGWHAAGTPAPAGSLLGYNHTVASTLTIGATAILGGWTADPWPGACCLPLGQLLPQQEMLLAWPSLDHGPGPCAGQPVPTRHAPAPPSLPDQMTPSGVVDSTLVLAGLLVSLSTLLVIGATSSVTFKYGPSPCSSGNPPACPTMPHQPHDPENRQQPAACAAIAEAGR